MFQLQQSRFTDNWQIYAFLQDIATRGFMFGQGKAFWNGWIKEGIIIHKPKDLYLLQWSFPMAIMVTFLNANHSIGQI